MNKKIKVTASLFVLMAFVGHDVQAMGGARDFARKLFISKAGAAAGLLAINQAVDTCKSIQDTLDYYNQPELDVDLPEVMKKQIEDVFEKDGIDISIKIDLAEKMCSPAGVVSCGGKKFLMLSSDTVYRLKKHGTLLERLKQYFLPGLFTSKDEIFAILEHEKSHLKNYDGEKSQLFFITYPSLVILGMQATKVCTGSKIVAGIIGLVQVSLAAPLYFAMCRQQEKRCDLSVSSSKAALDLAYFFNKQENLQKHFREIFLRSHPDLINPIIKIADNWFAMHPSNGERVAYLREHAENLKKQGK